MQTKTYGEYKDILTMWHIYLYLISWEWSLYSYSVLQNIFFSKLSTDLDAKLVFLYLRLPLPLKKTIQCMHTNDKSCNICTRTHSQWNKYFMHMDEAPKLPGNLLAPTSTFSLHTNPFYCLHNPPSKPMAQWVM